MGAASGHGHVLGKAFSTNTMPSTKSTRANLGHGGPVMKANEKMNRRDLALSTAAAATGLAGLATNAKPAFTKAGEFTKISFFGSDSLSSPYVEGGPRAGKDATFGYAKSDGPFLSEGWEKDVTREKTSFEKQEKIIRSQAENIEKKIWWLARDNLRGEAYTMKDNMKALNYVSKDPKASKKAYEKFWTAINAVDLACVKKTAATAQTEYAKALESLDAWKSVAL